MVFNSPRTWLTPSVVDKDGNVLWKGDTYKADATMFNGYRATNTCIKKVIEKASRGTCSRRPGGNENSRLLAQPAEIQLLGGGDEIRTRGTE